MPPMHQYSTGLWFVLGADPSWNSELGGCYLGALLAPPACGSAVSSRLWITSGYLRFLITIFMVGNDSNILINEKATHFFTPQAPVYK